MNIFSIAFRNVGRNGRRSILSGTAIAVATAVIVFMFSLIEGLKIDIRQNVFHMGSGQVRIRNAEYDANEMLNPLNYAVSNAPSVLDWLHSRSEIKSLAPRIPFATALYRSGNTYKGMGMGVDFPLEETFQGLSKHLTRGSMPSMGAKETVLSLGLAREMGVDVGDKITLFTKNSKGGMNGMTLKITGTMRFSVAAFDKSFFFLPLDTAQRLLGMPGSVTEVLLILRDGQDAAKAASLLAGELRTQGRSELSVKPWTSIGIWYSYLRLADSMYTIFALFFVLLGTTVIINTTMMVIYERVREIGTMGALGMTSGQIVGLFFLESFFIGAMGSLAGMLIGVGITWPFAIHGMDFSEAMKGVNMEISFVYFPVLNWRSTILAFLYSAVVTSAISIIPSRRASRVDPVNALRAI
jgi:putative ABC transport system permease protein